MIKTVAEIIAMGTTRKGIVISPGWRIKIYFYILLLFIKTQDFFHIGR